MSTMYRRTEAQRPPMPSTTSRPPFDVFMVEDYFPKVSTSSDIDLQLTQALLRKNSELTPSPDEQTAIVNLVSKVQMVLENITLVPGNFTACQIEEVRQVGSFKKGTMLKGKNKADLVVILKTLPIVDSLEALGLRVTEDLKKIDPESTYKMKVMGGEIEVISSAEKVAAVVRLLIATTIHNMRKIDPKIHVPIRILQRHLSAIRHVRWFEDSANLTTIKVLIRVLRDTSTRFEGLFMLSPWMTDVLAHYAVVFRHSEQLLSLGAAYKRVFQLLSSGLFLPGSTGIPDPCENGTLTLHAPLTNSQMDRLCFTSQTILRVLTQPDGYKVVLGFEPDLVGITSNESDWGEVKITPSCQVSSLASILSAEEKPEEQVEANGD